MRVGLAQINTTVGDLAGNRDRIIAAYRNLVAAGAELVVFPEMVSCGYPPRDLLLKRRFGDDAEGTLMEIAAITGDVPALVGTIERNPAKEGRPFFNAAALCQHGAIQGFARKCLLPTYDVFDEDRYFEPAKQPTVFKINGRRVGVTICEDIWMHADVTPRPLYHHDPVAQLAEAGVDLMVNLSASPWHHGKNRMRQQLVIDAAKTLGCPVVYVNAVGGNDELVFDGRSVIAKPDGTLHTGLAAFREDQAVIDLATTAEPVLAPSFAQEDMADVHDALVLGLRDYAFKSGFKKALVALSGGIDSAVVAVLAAEAFGAENVIGVSLPSSISSQHSRDDAKDLAANIGIPFETMEIALAVAACETALQPLFEGRPVDVTEENIQARIRGVLMMALSNKFGALLLTTGNKSEIAVGYCTLYGDMCGGLAVISDVFKTQVFALSRWMNREREIVPWNTINKPPSAELRPDQKDEDSLPPYDELDAILRGYVEEGLSRRDLVHQGFETSVVNDMVRKVDLNEYKRKQAAPGIKITPLAFGVGRRIPIVQKYVS
ncbi:NAD+ synthase [Synoicihabitans lomoniglobus]|uniref:Glutamine-dependent NAD(+) synthetase n=1 Tax=Synoicihabitans lomoniglobus TaxID=2909285 RepID=A0AAF0I2X6_9BACT|nr:NAD+ synthase [Opitutaceae bacterium LMO-M01]WED66792.1 NAD+ synthase [Opitutaceae bacterium LMO-M01]